MIKAAAKSNGHADLKQPQRTASDAKMAPALSVIIEANRVFSLAGARELLGLGRFALQREIRRKRLRGYKRCNKWFILGEDLLAWLRES
jgi:hypothetical protein